MQGLVTVFGGSGFIGGQVVRALAKQGLRVRVAVRRPNLAYRMRMAGDVGQIEIVQANVRNPASVGRALDGAEACVNLVAVFRETGRQGFQAVHVMGSRNVAEAAAARGIGNYVHMSAIGADAEAESRYLRSRALGEAEARKAIPTAVILRPSAVFGPEDRLFNTLAEAASIFPALLLPGGGEARLAPVCITDVAAAVAAAVTRADASGRTYELGGPSAYSWRELVEFVLHEIHRRKPLISLPFNLAEQVGKLVELNTLLPIPPLLTGHLVELLKRDNLPDPALPGMTDLGVGPLSTIEAVAPTYLYRYRNGGQFAEVIEAVSGSAA